MRRTRKYAKTGFGHIYLLFFIFKAPAFQRLIKETGAVHKKATGHKPEGSE